MIYLLGRPSEVGIRIVFDTVFGTEILESAQSDFMEFIPPWVNYNLPGGLWLFAVLIALGDAMRRVPRTTRNWVFLLVMLIPIGMEFLQLFQITDGTFDLLDLLLLVGAILCALTFNSAAQNNDAQLDLNINWISVATFFVAILIFGDEWYF